MTAADLFIRTATPDDADALLSIYAPYVTDTAISFEYTVPTACEFRERIRHTLLRYPYLVIGRGDALLGYAYTGPFHARAAYDWAVETSIYLRRDQTGRGIGKCLYQALEDVSRAQHVLNLNACIACTKQEDERLSNNSRDFHAHIGYRPVGVFRQCGYKFDTWYDMIWMEKHIGSHKIPPEPFIPFPALNGT